MRLVLLSLLLLIMLVAQHTPSGAIATHVQKEIEREVRKMPWKQCFSKLKSAENHPPKGYRVVEFSTLDGEDFALLEMLRDSDHMMISLMCTGGKYTYSLNKLVPIQ